ncbi:PREDICTED: putative odorant receptor 71a [Vollenhovia emeryi]|uniref:putative odorant receptor 71a n=1 Tax=Vollenhovia emeryi TaxID=411798 RepID=UPI0005F491A9|nr:PREDICTED: putative odorant receptor 71a [Vollenhovia emeryi]
MHTLPLSFALLTYTGYWRPVHLTSAKYWAYVIYSIAMNFLLYSFTFCGLVDCFMVENLEMFIEKFSLFLSVLGVSCKVTNLTLRRDEIIGLADMLLKNICVPRNDHETDIQRRFDRTAKIITICCEILNESAVFFATVAQFQFFINTRTLPLSDWVPYDISSTTAFWATMLHQTIGLMVCANASVAHETLISGFMIQTCAQLDILCHRARTLPDSLREARKCSASKDDFKAREQQLVRELVHHHRYVYRFAERVNSVFTLMIFVQFTISSTVLCLSIYKMLTKNLLSLEFAWSSSYLGCMLMQIYLYCWFGNEVTLKSTEIGSAVYEMDWPMLPVDLMKSLLVIITRSKRPITITSGYIVTLSNESFMKVRMIAVTRWRCLKILVINSARLCFDLHMPF